MDPQRKRTIRLVVALSLAVVLASALVYTSFSASSEAKSPSQLARSAQAGQSYELTGKVVNGSIRRNGDSIAFRSEEHTSELQSRRDLVCRLLLEKKKKKKKH